MIHPQNHSSKEEFDDLERLFTLEKGNDSTVIFEEGLQHSNSNRKKPRLKAFQIQTIKNGKPFSAIGIILNRRLWYYFLFGGFSKRLGLPFILCVTIMSGLLDVSVTQFKYNLILLLSLEASILYQKFPPKSIRPQMCLSILTIMSYGLDIYSLYHFFATSLSVIIYMSILLFFKSLSFYNFLLHVKGASRVRKYLDRRFRLFYIPLHQPKRIMRDVRGRLLALAWLHGLSLIFYVVFFFLFYFSFDFKDFYLDINTVSSILTFLIMKSGTTFLVFSGLMYDIDIRLCLWYFGCFGFAMTYIKNYIRERKKKLGGFPLVFSFYQLRFSILFLVKVVDCLVGLYGWILIFPFLVTHRTYNLESDLRIFLASIIVSLFVSDIYYSSLFFGIRWLLRRYKALKKMNLIEKSDDSEVEEFQLNNVEELIDDKSEKVSLLQKPQIISTGETSISRVKIKGKKLRSSSKKEIIPFRSSETEDRVKTRDSLIEGKLLVDNEEVDILDQVIDSKSRNKNRSSLF